MQRRPSQMEHLDDSYFMGHLFIAHPRHLLRRVAILWARINHYFLRIDYDEHGSCFTPIFTQHCYSDKKVRIIKRTVKRWRTAKQKFGNPHRLLTILLCTQRFKRRRRISQPVRSSKANPSAVVIIALCCWLTEETNLLWPQNFF